MNKKFFILIAISFVIAGCGKQDEIDRKVVDTPIPQIEEEKIKPEDFRVEDIKKIPLYVVSKMSSYHSYKSITKGETIADTFLMKTNQSIDTTCIKGEFSYMKTESHSNIVNTAHEAYYHNSSTLYKDNDKGDFKLTSLENYLSIYGIYPFENTIEGYIISDDTIVSVTKINEIDDQHIYKVVLDNEKSTNNVKIQMKKIGGLDEFPVFTLVEMNLKIKDDFTLLNIEFHGKYRAKKIVNSNCEQNYTVDFSRFNEDIEVPNLESIRNLFH